MDRAIDDPPNVGDMARQAVSDVIGLRLEYDKACAELLLGANADDDKRRQDLAKLSKAATEESTVDLLRVGDLWRTRRLFPKTSPPSSLRGLRCARRAPGQGRLNQGKVVDLMAALKKSIGEAPGKPKVKAGAPPAALVTNISSSASTKYALVQLEPARGVGPCVQSSRSWSRRWRGRVWTAPRQAWRRDRAHGCRGRVGANAAIPYRRSQHHGVSSRRQRVRISSSSRTRSRGRPSVTLFQPQRRVQLRERRLPCPNCRLRGSTRGSDQPRRTHHDRPRLRRPHCTLLSA